MVAKEYKNKQGILGWKRPEKVSCRVKELVSREEMVEDTQRGKVEQMGLKAQVEGTAAMKIP